MDHPITLYINNNDKHSYDFRGKFPTSLGTGLTNSVVGIIGCGNIGIAVQAKILSGFKLSELLYTSRKLKLESKSADEAISILKYCSG